MTKAYHDAASIDLTASRIQALADRCKAIQKRFVAAAKKGITGVDVNTEQRRQQSLVWLAEWMDEAESRLTKREREVDSRS
jgi:hypothetical protein